MNFEVIRNISLFLSVSLFVAVSGLIVAWEETTLLSSLPAWKSASIEDSVPFQEQVQWQYCDPFEIKREEHLPATRGPHDEISAPEDKPVLPDDVQEWVDVAEVNQT